MPTPPINTLVLDELAEDEPFVTVGPPPATVELISEQSGFGPDLPPTLWAAMCSRLLSEPSLGGLTGVYFQRPKPNYQYPLIIISPLSKIPTTTNKASYPANLKVQFTVLAAGLDSDVQSEALGEAAYRTFAPFERKPDGSIGLRTWMQWANGYEFGAIPGIVRWMEQPGRAQANQVVWAYIFDYRFQCGMTLV